MMWAIRNIMAKQLYLYYSIKMKTHKQKAVVALNRNNKGLSSKTLVIPNSLVVCYIALSSRLLLSGCWRQGNKHT